MIGMNFENNCMGGGGLNFQQKGIWGLDWVERVGGCVCVLRSCRDDFGRSELLF